MTDTTQRSFESFLNEVSQKHGFESFDIFKLDES